MFDIIILGYGVRGKIYGMQSLRADSRFRITGIVEPDEERRNAAKTQFSLPDEHCFSSVQDLCRMARFADAVFNCTMDQLHAQTTIPLLEKGYDVLLEKPIAPKKEEAEAILECAQRTGRFVMIGHVLRYTPFYRSIKECIQQGKLGQIINIQMAEQVSYYHASVSYIRGKFADMEVCGSGLLLSKCCHDLDLMSWLMNSEQATRVVSDGCVSIFKPENAPEGALDRCLPDCPARSGCPYAADTLYIRYPQRWANRVWQDCGLEHGSDAEKIRSLADPENRYGQCVYLDTLRLVDHQSVLISFSSGATGTFSVTEGAAEPSRTIHIIGTKAELRGQFEKGCFTITRIAPEAERGCVTEKYDLSAMQAKDEHGGGDDNILKDFFDHLEGRNVSISCSSLRETFAGHMLVYMAEADRLRNE